MTPDVTDFIRATIDDDLAVIATLTFFLCEAIFNAFPIYRARFKQLTALIVGGALGMLVLEHTPTADALIQGVLGGGAATIFVAKFKKPSSSARSSVSAVEREHL